MPLNHAVPSHQLIISQYQWIFSQLAANAQPGNLRLYLICDSENVETAKVIMESLVQLPNLQDCRPRLAEDCNGELLNLAKETILRVTRRLSFLSLPPFKFPHLPREIQLKVLEFTALVNPCGLYCRGNQLGYRGSC